MERKVRLKRRASGEKSQTETESETGEESQTEGKSDVVRGYA